MTTQDYSEFDGAGVLPSTIHPKGGDALTAGEKLRLGYLTGQDQTPNAPLDPGVWNGNEKFNPNKHVPLSTEFVTRDARIEKQVSELYKVLPY